jgi:hypothetical protein
MFFLALAAKILHQYTDKIIDDIAGRYLRVERFTPLLFIYNAAAHTTATVITGFCPYVPSQRNTRTEYKATDSERHPSWGLPSTRRENRVSN